MNIFNKNAFMIHKLIYYYDILVYYENKQYVCVYAHIITTLRLYLKETTYKAYNN